MRLLLLANNWVGWKVTEWLKQQGENIVGLVVHPPEKRKYGQEILSSARVPDEHVFDGAALRRTETLEAVGALAPDIGVSALFGYILRPELLKLFPQGVINLHPAYLPFNRGAYPNVWSIVEGTPAGVTLHYVDAGVDTGDIINQQEVQVEPIDTGETLYRKLERASVELFKQTWPAIRDGNAPRAKQLPERGTFHRTSDVASIDEIDLSRDYSAKELIDILRARTFPPHPGAYFKHGTQKVYLELRLWCEDAGSGGEGE